jgi:cell wall-associated NlpC family hydrolase
MKKKLFACVMAVALSCSLCGFSAACAKREELEGETENGEVITQPLPLVPEVGEGEVSQLPSDEAGESENEGTTEKPEDSEENETEKIETPTAKNYDSYLTVTAESVNLRAGAGTGYTVKGSAEKDNSYAVLGESGDWYKIGYQNGVVFIHKKYCTVWKLEKCDNEKVEAVIAQGYKLLGVKYVYGAVRYHDGMGTKLAGFTVTKFDCSSLTQYIFYLGAGTKLGVTTRTQVLQGKTVTKSQLQRGDLLFFTNASRKNNTGVERIGHVALYLGNNKILHTSSDYARIEEISSQRWSYFIQAQRMI